MSKRDNQQPESDLGFDDLAWHLARSQSLTTTGKDGALAEIAEYLVRPDRHTEHDPSTGLTVDQRKRLAEASEADMLAAIMSRLEIDGPNWRQPAIRRVAGLALSWADELRDAFGDSSTLERITKAVNGGAVVDDLRVLISADPRLTESERAPLLSTLARSTTSADSAEPVSLQRNPAYITSITVAGFRGIGSEAEMKVNPGPGLTVVYGPNGSGKSTFVEALDALLTGYTARFNTGDPEWLRAWRNAHAHDRGYVSASFSVGQHSPVTLMRQWVMRQDSTSREDVQTPDAKLKELGWNTGALKEFKPILGYGELGPLFDEDLMNYWQTNPTYQDTSDRGVTNIRDGETPFAAHLRQRSGANDPAIDRLHRAVQLKGTVADQPFVKSLASWYQLAQTIRYGRHDDFPKREFGVTQYGADAVKWLRVLVTASTNPTEWDPQAVNELLDQHPKLADLVQAIAEPFQGSKDWSSRTHVYCQMLVDALYSASFSALSQHAADIYSTIRPTSSAVKFGGLKLRQYTRALTPPTLRVTFDLTLATGNRVGRGVLSQGELHTLALSIFLPMMMRPESPFGFVVIDDPVQAMDAYAVDGLAEVLRDVAEELQVIVFTHDERLVHAVELLGFDHTRINVTRSDQSEVECDIASDPALRALERARISAARSVDEDVWMEDIWMNVALHCRHAVEHACITAGQRKLHKAGMTSADVRDALDAPKRHERNTTKRLMAIAIWGAAGQWQRVERQVKTEKWGEGLHLLIDQLNALVHGNKEKSEAARTAFGEDLEEMISKSAQLVEKIRENCV